MNRKKALASFVLFFINQWCMVLLYRTGILTAENQMIVMILCNTVLIGILISMNINYLKWCLKDFILKYLWYYLVAYFALILITATVTVILMNFGITPDQSANQNGVESLITSTPYAAIIMAVFQAPFIEEMAFRAGIIFLIVGKSKEKTLLYIAGFISILLFSSIHVLQEIIYFTSWIDLVAVIYPYVIPSFILVGLFIKSKKNILVPTVFHMIVNSISVSVTLMLY
jgi:hypothetical protein